MLQSCRLYIIVDRDTLAQRDVFKITEKVLRAGADIIQLRDKVACDRDFLLCARTLGRIVKKYRRLFIVNDRVDIAYAAGADGVHIGREDMPLAEVRRIMKKKIIGVSTHSMGEALKAQKEGADYIGIGPIYKTSTKKTGIRLGTDILARLGKAITIPFFAIGGITTTNIDKIKAKGCTRIAVASSVITARHVERVTASLKKILLEER